MSIITKNKTKSATLDEYINSISIKCENKIPSISKKIKINNVDIILPTIKNYNDVLGYNYNAVQLKKFAKHYNLKVSGKKEELNTRIFTFLYLSSYIIKVQKIFRGGLIRKYNNAHGPAYIKRTLCTNNSDFITMEPIEEIKSTQFISYKDIDDFIYGFDIVSIYNLILKSDKEIKNPYNRNLIPEFVLKNIKAVLRISIILKININLQIHDDSLCVSSEKVIELRSLAVFQSIDALGNYSNPDWFLSLNRTKLIKFIRELSDIWNYRAQLSIEIKRNVCPPTGDPFRNLNMQFIHTEPNMLNVKKTVLEVLENLVNLGLENDSKSLGAYYVLGALTLVNENAAASLPWLFQSVSYF